MPTLGCVAKRGWRYGACCLMEGGVMLRQSKFVGSSGNALDWVNVIVNFWVSERSHFLSERKWEITG